MLDLIPPFIFIINYAFPSLLCLSAAERLRDFDDELFKKAVYRRSLALFNLEEYERAAIDIGECVILEQERKEFRSHMDKVR